MTDLTPRSPKRPLIWPDIVYDLQDFLAAHSEAVYIVGGAVRDAYLHRPIHDIDLVVGGDALWLARRLANHLRGDFFTLDAERGVGRALVTADGRRMILDVARFRGGHLLADLTDRDFTVNAMAVDLQGDLGALIDPLRGEDDLAEKILRLCAPDALRHDPLRTLRALRFSIQPGLRIGGETLQAIRENAPLLAGVSPERQRDELYKLLELRKVGTALRLLESSGLLVYALSWLPKAPEDWARRVSAAERLYEVLAAVSVRRDDNAAASFSLGLVAIQLNRYRAKLDEHLDSVWANDRSQRVLLLLALLAAAEGEAAAEALRLSNPERQRLLLAQNALPTEALTPLLLHRFWRKLGSAGVDVCLLALAEHLAQAGTTLQQDKWLTLIERVRTLLEAYYDHYETIVAPPTLVNGEDLMQALNLRPGPMVGKLLDAIREAQVTGDVRSAAEALDLARAQLS